MRRTKKEYEEMIDFIKYEGIRKPLNIISTEWIEKKISFWENEEENSNDTMYKIYAHGNLNAFVKLLEKIQGE